MEFNERLGSSVPQLFGEKLQREKAGAEEVLLNMLELRSTLEGSVVLCDEAEAKTAQEWKLQMKYIRLHDDLAKLRQRSSTMSSEKVCL